MVAVRLIMEWGMPGSVSDDICSVVPGRVSDGVGWYQATLEMEWDGTRQS